MKVSNIELSAFFYPQCISGIKFQAKTIEITKLLGIFIRCLT